LFVTRTEICENKYIYSINSERKICQLKVPGIYIRNS